MILKQVTVVIAFDALATREQDVHTEQAPTGGAAVADDSVDSIVSHAWPRVQAQVHVEDSDQCRRGHERSLQWLCMSTATGASLRTPGIALGRGEANTFHRSFLPDRPNHEGDIRLLDLVQLLRVLRGSLISDAVPVQVILKHADGRHVYPGTVKATSTPIPGVRKFCSCKILGRYEPRYLQGMRGLPRRNQAPGSIVDTSSFTS